MEHFNTFTVADYVLLGRVQRLNQGIAAYAVGWPSTGRRERAEREYVSRLLAAYELDDVRDRRLVELPYGIQKLADVIRAVAAEPDLILLDEPAAGSSPVERARLLDKINTLRQVECTVLVVDHDVAFIRGSCDRIIALDAGRVIADGEPNAVLTDPDVVASYVGTGPRRGDSRGSEEATPTS